MVAARSRQYRRRRDTSSSREGTAVSKTLRHDGEENVLELEGEDIDAAHVAGAGAEPEPLRRAARRQPRDPLVGSARRRVPHAVQHPLIGWLHRHH